MPSSGGGGGASPVMLESGTPIAVGALLGALGCGTVLGALARGVGMGAGTFPSGTPIAVGAPARGVGTGAKGAVGVATFVGGGAGAEPGAIGGTPSAVDAFGAASIENAGTAESGTPTAVGGAAGVAGIGAVGTFDPPVGGRPGDVDGAAENAGALDTGSPSAVGGAGFGSEGGASHSRPARIRSTEPGSFSVLLNSARVGWPGFRAVSGSGSRVASSIVTGIRRVTSTSIVFPQ
jgi:hypothetical protein